MAITPRALSPAARIVGSCCLALVALAAGSCRRDPSPRIPLKAIEKCEDGVREAIKQRTLVGVQRIYHMQCASVFFEPPCHEAFYKSGRAPLARQDTLALEGCRTAYCPLLAPSSLEACSPGFQPTADNATRAWQPLQLEIIRYDARGYFYRVHQTLLGLYAALRARDVAEQDARKRRDEEARAAASATAAAPPLNP